jgi:hypothetical protein
MFSRASAPQSGRVLDRWLPQKGIMRATLGIAPAFFPLEAGAFFQEKRSEELGFFSPVS